MSFFFSQCVEKLPFWEKVDFLHRRIFSLLKKKSIVHNGIEGTWAIPLNSSRTSFPHLIR